MFENLEIHLYKSVFGLSCDSLQNHLRDIGFSMQVKLFGCENCEVARCQALHINIGYPFLVFTNTPFDTVYS